MTALWETEAFVAASGGWLNGNAPATISGVSIDSRTVAPGEAFVAIKGDNFDGHDFVEPALKAGAALAVVQDHRVVRSLGPCVVVPDDPLHALERIGAASRARMQGSVIAVTGSVGKTGTKEMLRLALSGIGATHSPVGSFNNHWGVPLTLARMPAETRFGVFEIGMNHPGEIRPLVKWVRPHVSIVTTVEPVHLAYFDGEEGIAEAKAEIFEGLEPNGTAIINRDNKWFDLLSARARANGARIVSFGESPNSDVRLDRVSLQPDASSVEARIFGKPVKYRLGAPGRHLVQNSLAVLAACHAVGAEMNRVLEALAKFRAPRGRGQQFPLTHPGGGRFTLIDESYNANPASMRAALALLAQSHPEGRGRRIAVLGDMLELGDTASSQHRGLAAAIAESGADLVFLAGENMAALWRDLPEARRGAYAESAAELEPILLKAISPGDVIMMKASLGTKLGPVVEAVKRHFAAEAA
jgi:UDP-N-acetylmuramoyl-tripeptide--D-alanyl-D-alanine ligase